MASFDVSNPLYTGIAGDFDEERADRLAQRAKQGKAGTWVDKPTARKGISRLAQFVAANATERPELLKRWQQQDGRKTRDAAKEAEDEKQQRDKVQAARQELAAAVGGVPGDGK